MPTEGYLNQTHMKDFYAKESRDYSTLPKFLKDQAPRNAIVQPPAVLCMACMKNEAIAGCRLCHQDACIKHNKDCRNPPKMMYWCIQEGCTVCRREVSTERSCRSCHVRARQGDCGYCHTEGCVANFMKTHPQQDYMCTASCHKCKFRLCALCDELSLPSCRLCHGVDCKRAFLQSQQAAVGLKRPAAYQCTSKRCNLCRPQRVPTAISINDTKPVGRVATTCSVCRKSARVVGCDLCHDQACRQAFVPHAGRARYICANAACKSCMLFRTQVTRRCLLCKDSIPAIQGCQYYCFSTACKMRFHASPVSQSGFLPYRCGNSACRTCHIARDGRRLCAYCNLPSGVTCGFCQDPACKQRLKIHNANVAKDGGSPLPTLCEHPACPTCRSADRLVRFDPKSMTSRTVFRNGGLVPLRASTSSYGDRQPKGSMPDLRSRVPVRT